MIHSLKQLKIQFQLYLFINTREYYNLMTTIGHTRFRRQLSHLQSHQALSQAQKKKLGERKWYFVSTYSRRWEALFSEMQESRCTKVVICERPQADNIMHPISSPIYSQLKTLKLTHNKINNIEALSFFSASQLQTVDLSQNRITSVKSMNKLHLPQLRSLLLQFNQIFQINLPNFHIFRPNVIIGFSRSFQQENIVQDIRFWLKFQRNDFIIQNSKQIFKMFTTGRLYSQKEIIKQKKTVKAIINKLRYREQ